MTVRLFSPVFALLPFGAIFAKSIYPFHGCLSSNASVSLTQIFLTALDRVPRASLKPSQACPICNNPFLDDPYPLVVRLPCHTSHIFDLECVRPWLRLRGTCPLDRVDFGKKEREKQRERWEKMMKRRDKDAQEDDEEEEWDGMYG